MRHKSKLSNQGYKDTTANQVDDISVPIDEEAISQSLKKQAKDNAITGRKIASYINNLTARVARGNYKDGIPDRFLRALGRQCKTWVMLPIEEKQSYLRMMTFIVKDKPEDFHLGDSKFHDCIIGGLIVFENAISQFMAKEYIENKIVDFPQSINNKIQVSKSDFQYAKLLQTLAHYVKKEGDPMSRLRRYDVETGVVIGEDIQSEKAASE